MDSKIYTKAGDDGSTRSLGDEHVRKNDPMLEALGALDELNSHLGLCLAAAGGDRGLCEELEAVQVNLLEVGATLAGDAVKEARTVRLADNAAERLEGAIDARASALPPLEYLIIPGGTELGARLHVARTVCRRAERRMVAAADGGANVPAVVIQYFNRLGDFLFVLARSANQAGGAPERRWDG
ncbi:MAG: cob(I)yrinic acid a,c-diamide adenosyltransferase [Planctomycetota bacterium]